MKFTSRMLHSVFLLVLCSQVLNAENRVGQGLRVMFVESDSAAETKPQAEDNGVESSDKQSVEESNSNQVAAAKKVKINSEWKTLPIVTDQTKLIATFKAEMEKTLLNMMLERKSITNLQSEIVALEKEREQAALAEEQPAGEQGEAQMMFENALKLLTQPRPDRRVALTLLQKSAALNHKQARGELAWLHLMGDMVEMDLEHAAREFDDLANSGLPEAHMGLAFLYSLGMGGKNISQPHALLHLTFAALGNNTFAQMALGYRYSSGNNVAMSCEKSLQYYKSVARRVASSSSLANGPLVHRVRLLDELDNPATQQTELVDYYHLLADKGDVNSQIGLGQLYFQGGKEIAQDLQKALEYFTLAANSGNSIGYAFLGKLYLEGGGAVKANNETALKFFQKAAEMNDPIGQSGLGLMYLKGLGVPADPKKAFEYFTLASEQGWVDGQVQLAIMYLTGNGVPIDYAKAEKLFKQASSVGHVLAYYNLGRMAAYGIGLSRSCPVAVEFFKLVAERGPWGTMLMRAYNQYKSGNIDESFMQYALLSEAGYEVAQSNAAFLLDREEVEIFDNKQENHLRAFYQLRRAAGQGNALAQVRLGDYYYYGLGIESDYEAAFSLYKRAADNQNNAQAAFNLGYMHENGQGIERDLHLAKRMYDMAASLHADAKIPVGLALLKLQFVLKLEQLKHTPFKFLLSLDENFWANWDLYMITVLTLLLAVALNTHRRRQQHLAHANGLAQANQLPLADDEENRTQQNPSQTNAAPTSSIEANEASSAEEQTTVSSTHAAIATTEQHLATTVTQTNQNSSDESVE